jgi:hypothetical protein
MSYMVVPDVSCMGQFAAFPVTAGGGSGEDSVRDRLSAWKLSPATAPVWRIRNPTESPEVFTVRFVGPTGCQAPVAVTHCFCVCTSEPPEVYSCSIRHRLRPEVPSTSPVPCSWAPCATLVAGLGEAYMAYDALVLESFTLAA